MIQGICVRIYLPFQKRIQARRLSRRARTYNAFHAGDGNFHGPNNRDHTYRLGSGTSRRTRNCTNPLRKARMPQFGRRGLGTPKRNAPCADTATRGAQPSCAAVCSMNVTTSVFEAEQWWNAQSVYVFKLERKQKYKKSHTQQNAR